MKFTANMTLIALLTLSGCNLGNSTGYVPTNAEVQSIAVGVDTTTSIEERFGRPTVVGERENVWYYIASRRAYPGPLPTSEVERRVLAITFDSAGVVRDTSIYDRSIGQSVAISSNVTPTIGDKPTLFQDVLQSVGRLSPEQILSNFGDDNDF